MLRKTTTLALAFSLGLLLAAAPASAAPSLSGDLFGTVRGAFAQFWTRWSGVWGEFGAGIDPAGQPAQSPAALWGEVGVMIDPAGQPAQAPAPPPTGISMGIDPNG